MTVLIIILLLMAIPLVGALFLSKQYLIEKEILINKPQDEVFNYVKFLENHNHFNKWSLVDAAMKKSFTGTDGAPGFIWAWDSDNKNVGKGEQEITNISAGRIDTELRFKKPFEGRAGSYISTQAMSSGQTKVKWGFSGERNYPNRILHFMLNLKKVLGKDIQASLQNLKNKLETGAIAV